MLKEIWEIIKEGVLATFSNMLYCFVQAVVLYLAIVYFQNKFSWNFSLNFIDVYVALIAVITLSDAWRGLE